MIVDCGGGTVDLTTRKLLEENQLSEITERAGDFCGSTFIDKEFIKLLRREVGDSAIDLLSDKHYGQLQYAVHEFCQNVKLPFTGNNTDFSYDIDLEEITPALLEYVIGSEKDLMEEKEWMITLDFNTIKSMFDPIVDRIIDMIRTQLKNSKKCSAIFLVGGFGQSKYLQKRVEEEFSRSVENISIPNQPVAAVVRGAAIYGKSLQKSRSLNKLNNSKCVIATRVLKYTFGVKVTFAWKSGDPPERLMRPSKTIEKFYRMVERGTEVSVEQEFKIEDVSPFSAHQNQMKFKVYYTKAQNADYCDEPGMEFLGELLIDLPDVHLGVDRTCTFCLSFGDMEIKARSFNQTNGQNYQTKFEFNTF
jgi:molecular chaperone DnaK (HSP70)